MVLYAASQYGTSFVDDGIRASQRMTGQSSGLVGLTPAEEPTHSYDIRVWPDGHARAIEAKPFFVRQFDPITASPRVRLRRVPCSEAQEEAVWNELLRHVGQLYDFAGVALLGADLVLRHPWSINKTTHRVFCSAICMMAWRAAGVPILGTTPPDMVCPALHEFGQDAEGWPVEARSIPRLLADAARGVAVPV